MVIPPEVVVNLYIAPQQYEVIRHNLISTYLDKKKELLQLLFNYRVSAKL